MERRASSIAVPALVLSVLGLALLSTTRASPPVPAEAAVPASLTVVLEVVPADKTRFTFDDAGGADLFQGLPRGRLILDANPKTAGFPSQQTFEGLANNGQYLVTQTEVAGYALSVGCTNDTGGRSILTPLANGISLRLRDSDAITCTFTNANLAAPPPVDTVPPELTLPPPIIVEATGPTTGVTFDVTAVDDIDGSLPADCGPPSGAAFALGETFVECTATDAAGNTATGSFTITVEDTTPPTLLPPSDLTVEAAGPATPVLFDISASDLVDPAPTVVCGPPSGALFPLGVTGVDCTATDASDNTATGSFTVTVEDTTLPMLLVPSDLTVEAIGLTTQVTFAVFALDFADPTPAVVCSPPSGAQFSLGVTTVNCSATDASDNTATGSFNVAVEDTTPPALALPSSLTVEATGPATPVTFEAAATDLVDPAPSIICTPPSGAFFTLGVTTVNCSATDASDNTATGSFNVAIEDTTPPTLTLPSNFTIEAIGVTTPVPFEATATDLADPAPTVVCSPPSGAGFPLGVATVNCSAVDASGNTATGSFTLSVGDTTPPMLTLPLDLTVEAAGPTTPLSYAASAVDNIDGDVSVACTPDSGDGFFYGVTPVSCSAVDTSGNTATGSFNVTVEDTTPPALTLPTDIRIDELPPGSGSAVVTFDASALDLLDGATPVSCAPASGATFPPGVTHVECSATDAAGNTASDGFDIEVVAVPWSLTIELEVEPQQSTDIPFTVSGDRGMGLILDDPVDNDRDEIDSIEHLEGTGNGVSLNVTAGPVPGFEVESIVCDGGTAAIAEGVAMLTLNAGDDVRCRFRLIDIDADDDGLADDLEALFGTDPNDRDSDGDGATDGEELFLLDTDPLDPEDGPAGGAAGLPRRAFSPPLPPSGLALTHYGGGTLGELLADLEAAGATAALLTTPDGRTAVLVVSELPFVIQSFVEVYFGVDASASGPASYLGLPIEAGAVLFVRVG